MINVTFDTLEDMLRFANRLADLRQGGPCPAPAQENAPADKPEQKQPVDHSPEKEDIPVERKETAKEETPRKDENGEAEYTLVDVREKLAQLQKSGKQAQVKELISSLGVKKLTEIPEEKYGELMQKAGEL